MNLFKKIFCRAYQTGFRMIYPILPYREPEILESTTEIAGAMKNLGLKKALIVTDEFMKKSGATEEMEKSLSENHIAFSPYGKARRQGRKSPLSSTRTYECKDT